MAGDDAEVYKEEAGCDPNKVRDEVRDRIIRGIVEANEKKENLKQTMKITTEMMAKELEDLKNKQDLEKQTLVGKSNEDQMELEKEMASVKKRMTENQVMWNGENRKMSVRHKEENEAVRGKFADEKNQKALKNLMKAISQLTDDLKKLDIDPNVAKKVDDATHILECPICMEEMKPPTRIWMCSGSHCVCEKCKDLLPRNMCPTCRTNKVNMRALTVENLATALFKEDAISSVKNAQDFNEIGVKVTGDNKVAPISSFARTYSEIGLQVTGENIVAPIPSFARAGLQQVVLDNIKKSGYTVPTPFQKHCLPAIMAGRDVMARAPSGSGKTVAFLIPIIHKIIQGNPLPDKQTPQCVIITPTRELALQIKEEATKLAMGTMVVCEGVSFSQLVKSCHILIATPERLRDLVYGGNVSFENVKFLVLDDANWMLELDTDLKRYLLHLSICNMPTKEKRQTLMFSSSCPVDYQTSAMDYLNNYLMINVLCKEVKQAFYEISKYDKREKLEEILRSCNPNDKTLVFVKKESTADFIATHLSGEGFIVTSSHGSHNQREREKSLDDFQSGKIVILVGTTVMIRSLYIKGVAHVINYDMPEDVHEYVRRIGRAGRGGITGKVSSFYDRDEDSGIVGDIVKILAESDQTVPDWLLSSGGGRSSREGGASAAVEDVEYEYDIEDW